MKKIWILSLLIGFSATASAAINSFDPTIVFPKKTQILPFIKADSYANESDLNSVQVGLNKDQVQLLIGKTQLLNHLMTERTWYYVFKFRELDKPDLVCQYQIQFDEHMKVSASYFNRSACALQLQPSAGAPAVALADKQPPVAMPVDK